MTAAIDLALAMVERDHGAEVARSVARKMVVYQRRAGGQSQFSALLDLEPKTDRIQKALTYARLNLQKDLSVEALADIAALSPRQFSRSQSPAKAIEHLRVEAARLMLEEGRLPIDVIAVEVGFGDRERMRRSFIRNIGHPPTSVRRNASQKRATRTGAHKTWVSAVEIAGTRWLQEPAKLARIVHKKVRVACPVSPYCIGNRLTEDCRRTPCAMRH